MPLKDLSFSVQSNDEGQFLLGKSSSVEKQGLLRLKTEPRKGEASSGYLTPVLFLSAFSAVIGCSMPMGYNNGVLNAPMDKIEAFFNKSHETRYGKPFSATALSFYWSATVSIYCLGAPFGCLFGSWIANSIGRRTSILYLNILLILAGLLQSCCVHFNSYEMFTLGRVLNGFKDGATCVVCPMYLSEIAPKQIRGGIGITFQLGVVFGTALATLLGCEILLGTEKQWPQLFNVLILVGCLQSFLLPFCPESPRFVLIMQGNSDLCRRELKRLRRADCDIDAEVDEILMEEKKLKSEPKRSVIDFFTIKSLRKPLLLACAMNLSQQLSGVNSLCTFSSSIFKSALREQVERNPDLKNYMVVAMWSVSMFFTFFAIPLVDRIGRKVAHLTGLIGMASCSFLVSFLLSNLATSPEYTCHGIPNLPQWANYLSVALLFLFLIFFAIGPSCIPWMLTPELFTVGTVSTAASIACIVNWLANFTVQFGFAPLLSVFCGWVFLLFVALMTFFIVYLKINLPETKGLPITEIVAMFE